MCKSSASAKKDYVQGAKPIGWRTVLDDIRAEFNATLRRQRQLGKLMRIVKQKMEAGESLPDSLRKVAGASPEES